MSVFLISENRVKKPRANEQTENKQPLREGNRDRDNAFPRGERKERTDRPDRPVTSPGEPFRYHLFLSLSYS